MRTVIALGLVFSAPVAGAMDMGMPPSVMAERYGQNAAELSACKATPDILNAYIEGAARAIEKKSKKPQDATSNLAIFKDSLQSQTARYASETDKPSCDDLGTRLLPVNTY